jgi:hypothetical protein
MADRSLTFDIEAIDKAGRAFESVAVRLDKLSARLDRLDRKRVNVDVDVNTKGAEAHLDAFERLAGNFGIKAGQGFEGGIAGVLMEPHVLAVALAAGTAALPAVANAAATATVLAFGFGLSGLGGIVEAKTAQGERALQRFKTDATSILRQTAAPFEDTFESILNTGEDTLSGLSGYLHDFYKQTGPSVERFFANLGKGVDNLGPSVEELGHAFSVVLDEIGPQLPGAFAGLGQSLSQLDAAVAANPQAFSDLVGYLGQGTQATIDFTTALTALSGWFDQGPVDHAALSALTGNLFTAADGFYQLILGNDGATKSGNKNRASVDAQTKAVSALDKALRGLNGGVLGVEQAHNRFLDTLHAVDQALHDNGRTLDRTTPKGRANREALASSATAALQYVNALKQTKAPQAELDHALSQARERLVDEATQFLGSRKAAEKYVTTILGIPPTKETRIDAKIDKAEANVAKIKRELQDPNLTKTRRAKLEAEKKQAEHAIAVLKAKLFQITHKDYTVTVRGRYYFTRPPGFIGPVVPHGATGGMFDGRGFKRYAGGGGVDPSGLVYGPGTGTSDSVPAMLSDGEYVIKKARVDQYGRGTFDAYNSGTAGAGGDTYVTVLVDGEALENRMYKVVRTTRRGDKTRARAGAGVNP